MNFKTFKYYDILVDESSGGGETAVIEKEAPSIAELMAKHGTPNSGLEPVAKPIEIKTEVKEEAKKEDKPESAATATKAETIETAKSEPQESQKEGKAEGQTPIKTEAPIPQLSLDEVLKKEQPDTIFKKLGLDDGVVNLINGLKEVDPKMVNLLNYWKENGDLKPYLEALNTDFGKMSAEEVMRHQLRAEYPKASEKAIDALFKKEVIQAYNLDSVDEDEQEEGKLLLEAKADKYRDELAKKQEDFIIPKPQAPKADEPGKQELEAEKRFESYKSEVDNSPITKDIFTNKAVTIGEGEEKFSFPVNPTDITDILYDSAKWAQTMYEVKTDADGGEKLVPKIRNQMLIATFAKDPDKFLAEYAKHFKSLGGKSVVETIDNAKKPDNHSPAKSEVNLNDPAAAMARQGKINSGGYGG